MTSAPELMAVKTKLESRLPIVNLSLFQKVGQGVKERERCLSHLASQLVHAQSSSSLCLKPKSAFIKPRQSLLTLTSPALSATRASFVVLSVCEWSTHPSPHMLPHEGMNLGCLNPLRKVRERGGRGGLRKHLKKGSS